MTWTLNDLNHVLQLERFKGYFDYLLLYEKKLH